MDVIIHLNYTSLDGCATLATAAAKAVNNFVTKCQDSQNLYTIFNIPTEFPQQWQLALNPSDNQAKRNLKPKNMLPCIPIYALPSNQKSLNANGRIQFLSSKPLTNLELSNAKSATPVKCDHDGEGCGLQHYSTKAIKLEAGQTLMTMDKICTSKRLWMQVRY